MRKKSVQKSEQSPAAQPVADYVVGQVCGSLFPRGSAAPRSLSALFAVAPGPAALKFSPAVQPAEKVPEVKERKAMPGVKVQASQSQEKPPKEKTAACGKLSSRESALANADTQETERRRSQKKGKRKAGGRAEEEAEEEAAAWRQRKRRRTAGKPAEPEEKERRTVFVGNLPSSCTKKTLQKLFRGSGAIESTRFRSVVREDPSMSLKVATIQRKVHPMKQSVNAYVVFQDEAAAVQALQRNGTEVEKDFYIRVDRVTESSHDHKRSIFVGNLAFDIKDESLRRHVAPCGPVEAVRLIRDKNTGLGKGFGYVLFQSADSVQLALELDGTKLEGRALRVKRSVKKEKKSEPGGAVPGTGPKGGPGAAPGQGKPGKGGSRLGAGPQAAGKAPKAGAGPSAFRGEMTDPRKKKEKKKKGLKRKQKAGKTLHL